MLKEILNLKGVEVLDKKIMKKIKGNGGCGCGPNGGGTNPYYGGPPCHMC
ncbi:hypothetical protein SAMN04487910_4086 [Aquimarina amphilecti]|uniref:Uncharacterized protein n=1 Tax=Aquimarina amphilecti TaxID=1038014 RepID=A0A1H7VFQ7_AQUAM|nr:hypothetical protein SAMN04487910_4086 [Aquimarina amphilecti]